MLPLLLSSGIVVSERGHRGEKQKWSSFLAGRFGELEIGVES